MLQIDKLSPWCTSNCWQGIVRQYPPREVGPQPVVYNYDVTNVTGTRKFYAQLTRVSGSATMQVKHYDALTLLRTDTCAVASGPPATVTCHVTPPAGTDWASVVVSGAATASYGPRIHHAGAF